MELNPNHAVTSEVREQWHKFCALLLHKFGATEVSITAQDVESLQKSGLANITVRATDAEIILKLVDDDEAERLAKKEGGLPI